MPQSRYGSDVRINLWVLNRSKKWHRVVKAAIRVAIILAAQATAAGLAMRRRSRPAAKAIKAMARPKVGVAGNHRAKKK